MRCPFHEDEHPSLQLYPEDWYCFGCRRGGSVVDFAGYLWNLHTRGSEVIEIRERLIECLPTFAQPALSHRIPSGEAV